MKNFEIVDPLPLHRQMTLVIFRDPDSRKCEVQVLPVSLKTSKLKTLQGVLKIPAELEVDAATVSVEVEESLSCEVLDWCGARSITPEQLVRAFICFCGEQKNTDVLRAWIRKEIAQEKIDIEKLPSITREELEQNIEAIIERVEAGESPILIRDRRKADALLFGWEDYLRRFSMLHTPEEIAEIEAACSKMEDTIE